MHDSPVWFVIDLLMLNAHMGTLFSSGLSFGTRNFRVNYNLQAGQQPPVGQQKRGVIHSGLIMAAKVLNPKPNPTPASIGLLALHTHIQTSTTAPLRASLFSLAFGFLLQLRLLQVFGKGNALAFARGQVWVAAAQASARLRGFLQGFQRRYRCRVVVHRFLGPPEELAENVGVHFAFLGVVDALRRRTPQILH